MTQAGKLGKLAPVHDPRTLMLERYVDLAALPPIPTTCAYDHTITSWGVMLNDSIGDCTCAAIGHYVQMATVNEAGAEVTIPDAAILTAYEAVGGYVPGQPNTDNGAVELTVLQYWRGTGVAGHKLGAWADVVPANHAMAQAAIFLFGALYIGFQVPASAMQQFNAGQPWDVVANDGGIEGGHAVVVIDYGPAGVTCVTWGQPQIMTWAFWDKYVDEVHAVLGPDWVSGAKQAPSGFNLAQLQSDLALVSGQPAPQPAATATSLTASSNPIRVGQYVTLQAAVTGAQPTGQIMFTADGAPLGSIVPLTGNQAQTTPAPWMQAGNHTLAASYSGDATNAQSTSPPLTLVVTPAFTPDATVLADIAWFGTEAAATLTSYHAGDVATAAADLQAIGAYGAALGKWLAGTAAQPARPGR